MAFTKPLYCKSLSTLSRVMRESRKTLIKRMALNTTTATSEIEPKTQPAEARRMQRMLHATCGPLFYPGWRTVVEAWHAKGDQLDRDRLKEVDKEPRASIVGCDKWG